MHTLILTDNLQQGKFIQKGFQYENLNSDLLAFSELHSLEQQFVSFDGFFLLFHDFTGIEKLIHDLFQIKPHVPIILLTHSHRSLYDELKASGKLLDYYVRPFPFRAIAALMRSSIFQLKESPEQSFFLLRDLQLDLLTHQVKLQNRIISLRYKEFALLHFLFQNKGHVLSRSTILENVWDRNANILTNTVDVHISLLRKKIDATAGEKYIHTVPCIGYLFS